LRPAPAGRPRRVGSSISHTASHARPGSTMPCVAAAHSCRCTKPGSDRLSQDSLRDTDRSCVGHLVCWSVFSVQWKPNPSAASDAESACDSPHTPSFSDSRASCVCRKRGGRYILDRSDASAPDFHPSLWPAFCNSWIGQAPTAHIDDGYSTCDGAVLSGHAFQRSLAL